MAIDTSRVKTWLLSSGLQNSNNALYQVILFLIDGLRNLSIVVDEISSSSSSTVIKPTTTINTTITRDGIDGKNGFPIKGDKGDKGDNGLVIPGRNGADAETRFMLIGSQSSGSSNLTMAQVSTRAVIGL